VYSVKIYIYQTRHLLWGY